MSSGSLLIPQLCLQVTNAFDLNDNGNSSLLLQWNKQAGCSWLGIGFGWDGWASKNLESDR